MHSLRARRPDVVRRLRTAVRVFCLMFAGLATCVTARAQAVDGFDPGANGVIYAMAVQPDGKIIVGGQFSLLGGGGTGVFPLNRIARLNPDGSVDGSFNPGRDRPPSSPSRCRRTGRFWWAAPSRCWPVSRATTLAGSTPMARSTRASIPVRQGGAFGAEVDVLAVQPDGKIIVGGEFTVLGGITRNRIGRLNANGTVDTAFNPNANDAVISLAVQPDGKIVVGGVFTTLGGATRNRIARLNSTGTLDTAFNPGANGNVDHRGGAAGGWKDPARRRFHRAGRRDRDDAAQQDWAPQYRRHRRRGIRSRRNGLNRLHHRRAGGREDPGRWQFHGTW